jgi:hypothetical protein
LNLLLPLVLNLPLNLVCFRRAAEHKFKTKMAPVKGAATNATAEQKSRRAAGATKTGRALRRARCYWSMLLFEQNGIAGAHLAGLQDRRIDSRVVPVLLNDAR